MRSSASAFAHSIYWPSCCTEGVCKFSVSRRELDQTDRKSVV